MSHSVIIIDKEGNEAIYYPAHGTEPENSRGAAEYAPIAVMRFISASIATVEFLTDRESVHNSSRTFRNANELPPKILEKAQQLLG